MAEGVSQETSSPNDSTVSTADDTSDSELSEAEASKSSTEVTNNEIPADESDERYVLAKEKPADGSVDYESSKLDVYGNEFHDVICFRTSSSYERTKCDSVVYLNKNDFKSFAGTFFSPELEEGWGNNTVEYVIRLDDSVVYETGPIDKFTEAVDFECDISGARKVEIACYYLEGSAGGLIGVSGSAYGCLADAVFTK